MRLVLIAALLAAPAFGVPCTELPVLFVVQDKSGSMAKAPDGSTATTSNPSKWSIAQQVVPSLASSFSNRFRFGAAMYPHDTTTFNCSTGTVVTPISSSPSGVQSAYAAAIPGGGTPTAASLQAVRSHLLSQGLTTPAYVLLITDGLPNCNTALDANSCSPTTPGCGPTPAASTCGLGAKDCLDSQATITAAQQLFAANIKVFVVGFDSTLTAGNNKAVLDAIAAAGGTGSAYVASSQAQLSSTLNTIAGNTATCCRDACTAGAAMCSGSGARQVCQLDAALGCTTWVTQQCSAGTTCSGGSCQTCSNQCTAGATRCGASGNAEQCVANAQGCTSWTTVETCAYGELCASGMCGSCQQCAIGSSRCTATGVETCDWDVLTGCTSWSARACPSGSQCMNGSCGSCNSMCTAGATRCAGNTVQTCVADAMGCTAWQSGQTCTNFCSGGACGTCGTSCTPGQSRCQGAGVETCVIDQNNCPAWGVLQQCAPNSFCQGGACTQCATTGTQGARRCGANGATEECRLDTMGCTSWTATGQCDVGAGERCDMGTCIPPCQDACAAGAGQCSNGRPQVCERGPTGCTVWRDDTVCGVDQQCVGGKCRGLCTMDEFEMCPAGEICTGVIEGRFCFPDVSDGGVGGGAGGGSGGGGGSATGGGSGAGGGGGSAAGGGSAGTGGGDTSGDVHGAGSGKIGASAMGCACGAVEGTALLPLVGFVLLLRRRRSA